MITRTNNWELRNKKQLISVYSNILFQHMQQSLLNDKQSDLDQVRHFQKLNYHNNASCFSKISFSWIFDLMSFGQNNTINQENLEDLSMEDKSQSVYTQWDAHWSQELKTNNKDPLSKSLRQTFYRRYIFGSILDFMAYQFTILTPLIIYFISRYLQSGHKSVSTAVFWMIITPLCRFLRSFFDAHGIYNLSMLGNDIANCVALGMVNKSLRYSTLCNKQFKLGEISSLMQVDCFRLALFPKNFNAIIFISYVLVFAIVFMAVLVGASFLAGVGVLVLASVINMVISRFTARYQKEVAQATDNRMKITNQVFNNIKFIKVNAWQEYFYDKLISRRNEEVKWYHKKFLTESYSTYSMWMTPKMILAATFGTYVATGGTLEPPIAFSIMSLYGYIQFYLQFLPNSISIVLQSFNALRRIQNFLLAEEIDVSCITYNQYESLEKPNAIEVQNGNFFWDKDTVEEGAARKQDILNLIDLNFTVRKGQMVAVIGDIGSGKSSLMYSLLGEMKYKQNLPKPRVVVNGTISLVTQKPWIVNDTVRNNILFGKPYNRKKYQQILHYACLKRDMELFTHGDKTMIGEKGATLSGGQKARISFARSLYSESQILLLDDLLSAVDVHVGKFLMTQTLLQYCRSKSRILITHALYYLKYVDKVLIMDEGRIVEQGNYEQIKNGQRFKDIFSSMMKEEKKAKVDINLLQIQAIAQKDSDEHTDQVKIEAEVIRQASIHTKKSRTQSAIDRTKLQSLRARKSQHPKQEEAKPIIAKVPQVVVEAADEESPLINELMMAEEMAPSDTGLKLYKSFAKYNRGYLYMALIILCQVIWMAFNAASNLWLASWTESEGLTPNTNPSSFYIKWYVVLGVFYGTFAFFRSLLVSFSAPKMSYFIHESMISNLLFSSLNEFFDRVPLGRIFNRLSKDLNSVDSNLPNYFSNALVFTFFLATNIVVICFIAPLYVFIPVIVVYLLCCHFLKVYYSKPSGQLTRLEGISKSPIVSCFSEILSGVTTIRCYRAKDMFFQNNCQKINQNKKPIIARKATEVWFTFRLTLLSFIINVTSLAYVLFFADKGSNSSDVAAKGSLLLVSTLGFDEIMYFLFINLGTFDSELVSLERCEAFMSLQPERGYVQYLKNREQLKIKSKERRRLKADGWPDRGRIDFIDLKCRYRKNLDLVLRGLTVTFQGGHKIGVVGRTGSGKSTIMMCLLRILEAAEGKIVLDGKDISQLSLDDLRSKITIILQDPCLFAGTIRQNLDPLNEYTDEQLLRSLEVCALKQTMESRKGLLTEITENGQNLSVGQRQLVSIARAVLKPTKIVLVDEATANIDMRTESVIYKAMNESFKNSTVITVAHRLNTVINSDRILVLQGGTLKEYDNPQQLLKSADSFFAQLYNESLKQNKM